MVLIDQMCRSWVSDTPGRSSRNCRTCCASTLAGTAASTIRSDSFSSDQVDSTISATITRLTAGSIQLQPVYMMAAPDTTTPSEMTASAAMCW